MSREGIAREAQLGFNFVRYLTSWRFIEPECGRYDEQYLDGIEERLDWYHQQGIRMMIDMHLDVWGPAVGGNGNPEWATVTEENTSEIGYDLFNERWESLNFGSEFETERLSPFYQRVINGIREVDQDN